MKQSLLVFFIGVFFLSSFSVFSQGPSKINFQAILRNTSGDIVSNQAVGVRMSIKSGTINNSSLYVETHTKTTDVSGLINIQLGTGTVISGLFGDIEWGSGSHFIQLEVDFNGGSNYVVIGTQELISVPYALYANKTDTSVLNLRNRFSEKVSVGDTSNMLTNYRTGLNSKVNISDTSTMLTNYLTALTQKVNLSDTTNMLLPYLRDADTTNMLVPYLRDADTTNMLLPYLLDADTTNMLVPYLRDADTTNMLVPYLRDVDTTNMLIPYLRDADTTNMLVPYLRDADTTNMLVPYLLDADTTNMLVPYLLKADTTSMLVPYLRDADTTNMLVPYLRDADTTNMLVPYLRDADTTNMLVPYLLDADTTNMLVPYLRDADTTNMLIPYLRDADTTNMLVPYLLDADTTNMLVQYLLKADTTSMLVRYLRDADTTNMLIPYLRDADTTNMLVPYLRDADTTNMLVPYLRDADTTNMLNSYFKKSDTTSLNLTNRFNEKLNVTDFPSGATTGNIMFFNGTSWVILAPGSPGQSLIISSNGLPTWGCIITNTAGTASSTPTLNAYSALTPITISTTGATGIGTATGLPTGVSASWTANTITISGTPSSAGSFTYTIPLTGGCGSVNATGSMTVNALVATLATTSIGSITSTDASSGGNITFDGGEITARGVVWSTSTGPTVSLSTKTTDGTGTGSFTSTISGLSATTTYYVRAYATNSAGTAYGNEVTFTTCTLNTAGSPSSSPSLTVNTALTNITISTTGATGIGTYSGLPAGVTASWSNNVITISGTPTATGSFTYTIPLTVGCGSVNATGTITVTVFSCGSNSVSDIDVNTYNTVSIGNQCWMSGNLKTSRYRNGELIPIVTDYNRWRDLRTGGRSWQNNDSMNYENPYGNFYNWYAVADSRGLCPTGWHVPTDSDWNKLVRFIDSNADTSSNSSNDVRQSLTAGGKMKSTGSDYWNTINIGNSTNETGFSALPGGFRSDLGSFSNLGCCAFFWSATEYTNDIAWFRVLFDSNIYVHRGRYDYKRIGASVRCLKD